MRSVCARHEKPEARSQRPERVCLEDSEQLLITREPRRFTAALCDRADTMRRPREAIFFDRGG